MHDLVIKCTRGRPPVEGGLDVPEEVESQLLGLVLAVHLAVLLMLSSTQRVCKGHLQASKPILQH